MLSLQLQPYGVLVCRVVPGPSILNMVVDVCLQCFSSSMARERLGCVQGFPRCTRLDFSFLFFLGHSYRAGHCVNVIFMSFSLTSQVLLQGRRESTEAWAKSQTLELQHTERDSGFFSLSLKHDLFFFSSCGLEEKINAICSTSVFPLYCGCLQRNLLPSTLM